MSARSPRSSRSPRRGRGAQGPGRRRRGRQPRRAPPQEAAVVTMELERGRPAPARGRDLQAPPAPLPRGQLLRRCQPREPERGRDRRRPHLPGQPDGLLGPARPDPHHPPGRRSQRPAGLPQPVRQRADQARRRRGLPRALPDLGAGGQVHLAGQRGLPRHRAGRPARHDQRPRPGGPGPRAQRADPRRTWSPTCASSPARSPQQDAALGRAIEELPGVARARRARPSPTSTRSFPALRAFAREALPGVRSTPATLRRRDPVHRTGPRARLPARAARPASPTCARRSPGLPCSSTRHGRIPRADARALVAASTR